MEKLLETCKMGNVDAVVKAMKEMSYQGYAGSQILEQVHSYLYPTSSFLAYTTMSKLNMAIAIDFCVASTSHYCRSLVDIVAKI
jgi:hypothetical protein